MECTKCDEKLEDKEIDGLEVHICPGCKGIWMPQRNVKKLVQDYGLNMKPIITPKPKINYECPNCQGPVSEIAIHSKGQRIDLDVCDKCYGLHFDDKELRKTKLGYKL